MPGGLTGSGSRDLQRLRLCIVTKKGNQQQAEQDGLCVYRWLRDRVLISHCAVFMTGKIGEGSISACQGTISVEFQGVVGGDEVMR